MNVNKKIILSITLFVGILFILYKPGNEKIDLEEKKNIDKKNNVQLDVPIDVYKQNTNNENSLDIHKRSLNNLSKNKDSILSSEKKHAKDKINISGNFFSNMESHDEDHLTLSLKKNEGTGILVNPSISNLGTDLINDLDELKSNIILGHVSYEELASLLSNIDLSKNIDITKSLLDSLHGRVYYNGEDEISDYLLASISSIDSPDFAKYLTNHLVNLSQELYSKNHTSSYKESLQKIIRKTTDSMAVAENISQYYFQANTDVQRDALIEIGHLESFVKITLDAISIGDTVTTEKIKNAILISENKEEIPSALLSIYRKQDATFYPTDEIKELAANWSMIYSEGEILDTIESQLIDQNLSESEEQLIIGMLESSPDPRSKAIIKKYNDYKFNLR